MYTPHLSSYRISYLPKLPPQLERISSLAFKKGKHLPPIPAIKSLFPLLHFENIIEFSPGDPKEHTPLKVGVVFSGGQASGGHNVVIGLFDALKKMHPQSELFGFLEGPSGIIEGKIKPLGSSELLKFRNQGGFDLLGSGRTKIETEEQLKASLATIKKLNLDGIVIIGGDDSNTNAAVLAQYLLQNGCPTRVVGVPKTIDGDLRNEWVEMSFGFDTACKVYSEMIGNICRDALSARKYYHFIKLMGRSASHIALECALTIKPNMTLIGEEIAALGKTFHGIVKEMTDLVCKRYEHKKHFGVILIPEGVIEFIPEMKQLIGELNTLLANSSDSSMASIKTQLSEGSRACLGSLPVRIQEQLFLDRDPHGNVRVSQIETEKLFMDAVMEELKRRGHPAREKFNPVGHFMGYEGRCAYPSNFDADYCYCLGYAASAVLSSGLTGYMVFISNLKDPYYKWSAGAVPLTSLMDIEERKGKPKPVITKYLVNLNSPSFKFFAKERVWWEINEAYTFPGPIQFYGDEELTDTIPLTLRFDRGNEHG